jgi:putative transposase
VGYRRVHGELLFLGVKGRSQAEALPACDFFETVTLQGTRMYVLAVIEHHTRRIRVLGATAYPTGSWVTQAPRNLSWTFRTPDSRYGS